MRQIYTYIFLPALFLIFNSSLTYTQEIEFNRIIPEDGTNFGSVGGITQDKDGFMWFSTRKGLYRYDGNRLTRFKHDSLNINSISSNSTGKIHIDPNGILWIGCREKGLDRYDPETEIFTHFRHDPHDSTSIASDAITEILRDHKGKLWIGTNQGLDLFDPETNSFIHFKPKKGDTTSLSELKVNCLYEDKHGTLWIGTGVPWKSQDHHEPEYGGLNRYNRATGTFTQYKHKADDPQSLISNKVFSIYEDNKGVLWIGTHKNGLHQMDREKGTFKQMMYDPAHPETFGNPVYVDKGPGDVFRLITQDTTGGYWLGKMFAGLFYYNPAVGKMLHFQGTGNETDGFMDGSAECAFTSRDGALWIGGKNIYRVNVLPQKIPKPFVSNAPVSALYEEPDGTFWIGKQNDLMRVDKKTGDTLKFNTELKFKKDSTNFIRQLRKDHEGTLWVAASSGLFKWDDEHHTFTDYHHDPENKNSLSYKSVTRIYEDSQHNFWVGAYRGLNQMDRKTGEFTQFTEFQNHLITDIFEDKSGYVWISSWWRGAGLKRFNPNTKSVKAYLDGSSIAFIYEDSDGVLWAGGKNGLYTFDPGKDDFIRFGDSYTLTGLPDAYGMVEDNQKNLWITTSESIVRLNRQRNQSRVFGKSYSIEKNSLNNGAVLKGNNGDIYFGSNTGYYQINPVEFVKNTQSAEIFFTRFLVFDREIKLSKNGPLKEPLSKTKSIKLPYAQNVFSIEFALIDYIHPEDVRLLYYLENYDHDWIEVYTKRQVSYYNVQPGRYVFHVKGANSDDVWADKKIEVIILPPWYRTWLAYTIYALLFIAAVFAFTQMQRKRIIRKEWLKTQERELAHAKEIEKAYTELKSTQSQLIQSEKMASLGELTAGIAHEIQNPLNFVNNFSEVSKELLDEMKEEIDNGDLEEVKDIADDVIQNLKKINHHGKRADSIVKGMLQHSRSSSGQKELTDINALADEYLRLSYHGLRAKDKSFNADFKLEADESIPKINVIPQDIGRVLLNLINNAFYAVDIKAKKPHPPEGGASNKQSDYKPMVEVRTSSSKSPSGDIGVKISVKDNGLGIPDSIKDKIFQPFFTTKPTGSGTGLGLSLSYDIVKVHGGEIKVTSELKEGTTFTIELPINTTK